MLGGSVPRLGYASGRPPMNQAKCVSSSQDTFPFLQRSSSERNEAQDWNPQRNPRDNQRWDDSSCAERNSHSFTPTGERAQYATSEGDSHWTLKQVAIFAHLKYTQVSNWGSGPWFAGFGNSSSCEGERRGRSGSLARGNRTPAGVLFITGGPIVFYGREGYICP